MAKKNAASAGPLGLICFGLTTCLVMLHGLYPGPSGNPLPLTFVLGGIVQIIAGVIEIYRTDIFIGTVFSSYGCFWVGVANGVSNIFWFCGWGLLTCGFFVLSLRTNIATVMLFGGVAIGLFLIGAGSHLTPASVDVLNAGLWTGLVMGCLALYLSFGTMIHDTYKILLPGMAPLPDWFPICCRRPPQSQKPRESKGTIMGVRFRPPTGGKYSQLPAEAAPGAMPPQAPTPAAVAEKV